MNNDTRVLATKSVPASPALGHLTPGQLRRMCDDVALRHALHGIDLPPASPPRKIPSVTELNRMCRNLGLPAMRRSKAGAPDEAPSLDDLRAMERNLGLDPPDVIRHAKTHTNSSPGLWGGDSNNGDRDAGEKRLTPDELKAKADSVARQFAPTTIAESPC
jgi:hypothetical protein